MKQILQSLRTGKTETVDVPCPAVKPGYILIRSGTSLISAGTERMLVEFGKAGLLQKARQQPDKLRQVYDKVKTEGLVSTVDAVRSKLDEPLALGYCNVGTVLEVGSGTRGFAVGDRVLSNGSHAQVVCVGQNLCVKIPDGVTDEAAAFAVLGAIGLQGIRLAQPTLGEAFVVSGLGLIGLLAVQLLRSHGCRVLGLDFDARRLQLAAEFGAEVVDLSSGDPLAVANAFSRGRGVDGVLIAASTKSDDPIHQAAQMCRQRGRIVLIGATGMKLSRADFYEKELSFQVSCSYGPGRYDPSYEEQGRDYPVGFVRWTQQRNFEAVLDMIATGRLDPTPLVSHRFSITSAAEAYDVITGGKSSLGVLLEYPPGEQQGDEELRETTVQIAHPQGLPNVAAGAPVMAVLGAGNFAKRTLIPAIRRSRAVLQRVAAPSGLSALLAARRHEALEASSDVAGVLHDPAINSVAIATPHDSHARLASEALRMGKHVYVEKPLAISVEQLEQVCEAHAQASTTSHPSVLMVGFNRRFAPLVQRMHGLLEGIASPKSFVITVNAGAVPLGHWAHDRQVGGGQVIGEGCHFVDLLRFLCGYPVVRVYGSSLGLGTDHRSDVMSFTLEFSDGSTGTVHYLANGHRSFPKERIEVFCGGRILQLDNFRQLRGFGWPGFRGVRLWRQDKGHDASLAAFLDSLEFGKPAPIPFAELVEVTQVTLDVVRAAETHEVIEYAPQATRSRAA